MVHSDLKEILPRGKLDCLSGASLANDFVSWLITVGEGGTADARKREGKGEFAPKPLPRIIAYDKGCGHEVNAQYLYI